MQNMWKNEVNRHKQYDKEKKKKKNKATMTKDKVLKLIAGKMRKNNNNV